MYRICGIFKENLQMSNMRDFLHELLSDQTLKAQLTAFLKKYGKSGLRQAMQSYSDLQKQYICKSKNSISKIQPAEILYLEIQQHTITIHTASNTYRKYGSLESELSFFPPNEFMKCNQSCVVAIGKIKDIYSNNIILTDNTKLRLSRNYAQAIIFAFHGQRNTPDKAMHTDAAFHALPRPNATQE